MQTQIQSLGIFMKEGGKFCTYQNIRTTTAIFNFFL